MQTQTAAAQNSPAIKKRGGTAVLLLLGLISGLTTAILFTYDLALTASKSALDISRLPIFSIHSYIPGILFGSAIALYFLFVYSFSFLRVAKSVLFVLVSCAAWFLSLKVGLLVSSLFGFLSFFALSLIPGFIFAGITGAVILLIGLYGLIFETPMRGRQGRLVFWAGALGLLGLFAPMFPSHGDFFQTNLALLFIVWQAGVALAISALIPKN